MNIKKQSLIVLGFGMIVAFVGLYNNMMNLLYLGITLELVAIVFLILNKVQEVTR